MMIFIDLKSVGLLGVRIYRPNINSEITALAGVVEDAKKTWNIQVCKLSSPVSTLFCSGNWMFRSVCILYISNFGGSKKI